MVAASAYILSTIQRRRQHAAVVHLRHLLNSYCFILKITDVFTKGKRPLHLKGLRFTRTSSRLNNCWRPRVLSMTFTRYWFQTIVSQTNIRVPATNNVCVHRLIAKIAIAKPREQRTGFIAVIKCAGLHNEGL